MKNNPLTLFSLTTAAVIVILTALTAIPEAKAFIFSKLVPSCFVNANANTEVPASAAAPAVGEASAPSPAGPAAAEAPLAPSLVFKDGKGNSIDISKQKGKVLFINFWATWCPPCIAEMPSIAKLKDQVNSKDMLFLMVDVDRNYDKAKNFMDKNKYPLPVYMPTGEIPGSFLSGAIPTTVIIDKAGRVVGRQEGGADYASPEAIAFFQSLIKQ